MDTGENMPNKSRDRGIRYEREIVAYLQTHGYPHAERKLAGKDDDTGDINAGPPNITLELKDCKKHDLSGWLEEAKREAHNAGNRFAAVVIRRRGPLRNADYVVMDLYDFLEITREQS
jgi:Holliday junction resolvase